jgi:hypothetical protein
MFEDTRRITKSRKSKDRQNNGQMRKEETQSLTLLVYHHRNINIINTTSATSGAGTAYFLGASEFIPVFIGIRVTQSLVFSLLSCDRYLSFLLFSFVRSGMNSDAPRK